MIVTIPLTLSSEWIEKAEKWIASNVFTHTEGHTCRLCTSEVYLEDVSDHLNLAHTGVTLGQYYRKYLHDQGGSNNTTVSEHSNSKKATQEITVTENDSQSIPETIPCKEKSNTNSADKNLGEDEIQVVAQHNKPTLVPTLKLLKAVSPEVQSVEKERLSLREIRLKRFSQDKTEPPMAKISFSKSGPAKISFSKGGPSDQVWPLTHFFLLPFYKKSH